MNDQDCELLYRRAVLLCEQIFRLRNALQYHRKEIAGYVTELEKCTQDFEMIAARAWNAYSDADTTVFGQEALAAVVCDERIRFDDA